ncbi:hypothetical protein PENSPDRAFT_641808 [Peniophora sp. CONT]|nr:hypothetical protein PENSPDRAFT_641808 [Peniophora sp. CONT]
MSSVLVDLLASGSVEDRSESSTRDGDLDTNIVFLRRTIESAHVPNPAHLERLGILLAERYDSSKDFSDIEGSISSLSLATDIMWDDDPSKVQCLSNLGISLQSCFEHHGNVSVLDRAISVKRAALEIAPDTHPLKPIYLSSLGTSLRSRYERLGQREDMDTIITSLRHATGLVPLGHPLLPALLNNLCCSFQMRYDVYDELHDIESAISAIEQAIELTPHSDSSLPGQLDNLGIALRCRYKRMDDNEDIAMAIFAQCLAVELTSDPNGHNLWSSLGTTYGIRYDRRGNIADLESAISAHRHAVTCVPLMHEKRPMYLASFSDAMCSRFRRLDTLEDLECAISMQRVAIELLPDGHIHKPKVLNNLGNCLQLHSGRVGTDLDDLQGAILVLQQSIDLTPERHPDKRARLHNLGICLWNRYQCTNELDDLEKAISVSLHSAELTPDNHPDKRARLSFIGVALNFRYERTRDVNDLENAVSIARRAAELTPDDHTEKPAMLNNLGTALNSYYVRSKDPLHLDEGIAALSRVVELAGTSPDRDDSPGHLSNLAGLLLSRFQLNKQLEDIEHAVSSFRLAITLTPVHHPNLTFRYTNLAIALQARFEEVGELCDLEEAIALHRATIERTPDTLPSIAGFHNHLGDALISRFERKRDRRDFDEGIDRLMAATVVRPLGSPAFSLSCALRCLTLLSEHPEFSSSEKVLLAHTRMMEHLHHVVWLGHSVSRRFEMSAGNEVGSLVCAAVSAAISARALPQAVEWLEDGRALVWAQVLAMRTPVDELMEHHPSLALALHDVLLQLQHSGHYSFDLESDDVHKVSGIVVNPDADSHRQLTIKYESLLGDIRRCPGFDNFMRPKKFADLLLAPETAHGPVVFINVEKTRSDALILFPGGTVSVVELSSLTQGRAEKLLLLWRSCLRSSGVRERAIALGGYGGSNQFFHVLKLLWVRVVFPILDAMDLIRDNRIPHVTWCPTGPLTQLPLHAAGLYNDEDGPRVYDFVVSSYTPTLSALRRSQKALDSRQSIHPSVLVVTQPHTPNLSPLPGTKEEGARIETLFSKSHIVSEALRDQGATVESVRTVLDQYPWVHLACHGSQHLSEPTKSSFALYDGPLSLSALMSAMSDKAELAFLSACQTAVGDEKIPEESAHLAAGMLAVGFKGVVATMWSIGDADAPVVVEAYYKTLLELRLAPGAVPRGSTGAAYALHEATKYLREKVGETEFVRWAPFVHFGA